MKTHIKLALLLLASLLPATASASAYDFEVDGIYYKKISDYKVSVVDGEEHGHMIIPGTVTYNDTIYSVTEIADHAFSDWKLFSIEIPNTVTSIGDYAFNNCSIIDYIDIPESVTTIGEYAFHGCERLQYVSLPNSVRRIGEGAFIECYSLSSIHIPDSVETIESGLFMGCLSLSNVFIPNSVTSIGNNAFYACFALRNIDIPNSVSYIGRGAFYDCKALTSIVIPQTITCIEEETFYRCSALTSVIIGDSATTIENYAFYGCSALNNIIIPNLVTSIGGYAFFDCSSLKSVTIPKSVTSIDDCAFENCTALKSVNIFDLEAWCNITFCNPTSNPVFLAQHLFLNGEEISDLVIPESTLSINDFTFICLSSVKSITIPNSVTSIGEAAFFDCADLTCVTIPNSVTSIDDYAFVGCENLTTLFVTGEGEWTAGDLPNTVSTLYIDNGITGVKGMKEKPKDVFSFAVTPPVCDENSFTDYSGTLHVPAASIAAYFTAPYWCNFANIVGDAVKPNGLNLDKDSLDLVIQEMSTLVANTTPATAASSIAINWASSNPAVATVVNGQVTAVGYGECDIVAMCLDQSAVCHVTVYSDCISVDQEQLQVQPNHIVALTPTSLAPELPALVVTSSDPTVAAARVMNGKVQVVGVSEGTATITVSAADGTAKPATCLVTVYTEQGDTNGDGYIDIDDVTALIEGVLGNEATSIKEKNADLNDDGIMDIDDVTALINTILGNN